MNCSPPGSFIHGDLPKPGIETGSPALRADSLLSGPPGKPKKTGLVSQPHSPGDLPNPGIETGSPALQADSLPAELPRKAQFMLQRKQKVRDTFPKHYPGSQTNSHQCFPNVRITLLTCFLVLWKIYISYKVIIFFFPFAPTYFLEPHSVRSLHHDPPILGCPTGMA